jgi:RNA polymerase sigma-70 factor (ECF subfamily)
MTGSCTDARQASASPSVDVEAAQRITTLLTQQHSLVWRSLRRFGVSESDADDASQQVFLVAYRRLNDIAPGSERSFLLQTALRVAADFRRSRKRRREEDGQDLRSFADSAASPEDLVDRQRACAILDRVLAAMPMDLRTVFVLFEIEGLTMEEISSAIEIPSGTVASRLRRARAAFREAVSSIKLAPSARREAGGRP